MTRFERYLLRKLYLKLGQAGFIRAVWNLDCEIHREDNEPTRYNAFMVCLDKLVSTRTKLNHLLSKVDISLKD